MFWQALDVRAKTRKEDRCQAYHHGTEDGSVTLGGRRVPVRRPRVCSTDSEQGGIELLADHMVAAMVAGVSTRKYPAALKPVDAEAEQ